MEEGRGFERMGASPQIEARLSNTILANTDIFEAAMHSAYESINKAPRHELEAKIASLEKVIDVSGIYSRLRQTRSYTILSAIIREGHPIAACSNSRI